MISLCPGCHARVHRTKMVLTELPPLASGSIARAAHGRSGADRLELQSAEARRSSGAAGVWRRGVGLRSQGECAVLEERMNLPDLVDVVNENAVLISELIAEEILLVDTEHR